MTMMRIVLAALALAGGAANAADAARGRELYETRCIACHSIDANRVGPAHRGVFGRKAGSVRDYDYSPAVAWPRSSGRLWRRCTR